MVYGFTNGMEADLERVAGGATASDTLLGAFGALSRRRWRPPAGSSGRRSAPPWSRRWSATSLPPRGGRPIAPAPPAPMAGCASSSGATAPSSAAPTIPECRYSRPLAADPGDGGKNREPMALGIDPETGLPLTLRRGRYGRYVQRGEDGDAHARRGTVPMSMDADDIIHDPRHTYASRALALGESLSIIVRPLTAISGSRSMSKREMRAKRRWPAEDIRKARYSSARRKRADVRLCAEKHAERDRHTAGIPDGGSGAGVARSGCEQRCR